MDEEVSEDVRMTSPWCWGAVRLFAFASQWELTDVVVVPLLTAEVVLFTSITASALRLRIFALCSCALARKHAMLLLRNSSGSVVCASWRAADWWFWWSVWCWSSCSRSWCWWMSLLFSTALWLICDCCCCCCCCCCVEELFVLLSLLSVVMEEVSCWSSLSELQPSSLNCSAASSDFRCIPVQSRQDIRYRRSLLASSHILTCVRCVICVYLQEENLENYFIHQSIYSFNCVVAGYRMLYENRLREHHR